MSILPADRVWGTHALEDPLPGAQGPWAPKLETPGLARQILEQAGFLGAVEGTPVLSWAP